MKLLILPWLDSHIPALRAGRVFWSHYRRFHAIPHLQKPGTAFQLEELRMSDTRRASCKQPRLLPPVSRAQRPPRRRKRRGAGPFASAAALAPDAESKSEGEIRKGRDQPDDRGHQPVLWLRHYNNILSGLMKDWYTPAKVVEVLQRAEKYGINGFNYWHISRSQADWERYLAEGGKMHIVAQATTDDPKVLVDAVKPMAAYAQGDRTDSAFHIGELDTIRDYCKKLRDLGVTMVGVGSHIPRSSPGLRTRAGMWISTPAASTTGGVHRKSCVNSWGRTAGDAR